MGNAHLDRRRAATKALRALEQVGFTVEQINKLSPEELRSLVAGGIRA